MLSRSIMLAGAVLLSIACPASAQNKVGPGDLPSAVDKVFFTALAWIGPDDPPSSGSGFLVSGEGHVLTAWHVLDNIRKAENGGRDATYIKSRYTVQFNTRDGSTCRTRVDLVGASEYRDVAVLKINAAIWKRRSLTNSCLSKLEPVSLSFDFELEDEKANEPDALSGNDDFQFASNQPEDPFGRPIFPLGHPSGCLQGSGANCRPHSFDAWSTRLLRQANSFGLLEVEDQVPLGMSGGPAVYEDGTVVGMMVASGRDMGKEKVEVVPVVALELPLWTFGITHVGASIRDYRLDLRDIIASKAEIEAALDTLNELKNKMHKPDLVDFHIVHNETMGADLIVLKFKKQLTTMSAPAKFEFEIECSLSENSNFNLTEVSMVSEEDMRQASRLTSAFHVPGTRLTEQALSKDGTMAASIPRPLQELQDACVEYFTELARLSGQQVELTVDDFKSLIIRPTAIFPQADVDDHPLAEIIIPLAGIR